MPTLVDAHGVPAEAAAKKKNKPLLIIGAIALAGSLVAAVALFVTRGNESTDDAQVDADVVPLAPRVGGMVLHVKVADNAEVEERRPLGRARSGRLRREREAG